MRNLIILCVLATVILATPLRAQEATPQRQPTPEEMQKIMDATMGAMVPMMGRMTEVMIEAQLKSAALPDTAERLATFKRNLYDALMRRGFSKSEALQIVMATGIPSATPSSK
jgi:hypothetical protein